MAIDSAGRIITKLDDGSGNAITSSVINSKQRLDVNLSSEGTSGAAVPFGTQMVGGKNSTNLIDLSVDTTGQLKVDIFDASGNAFTTANPLPVLVSNTPPGAFVNKYNTTAALAAGSSTNHDYTITATKTLTVRKFWASGSGKIRMDAQTSPDGTVFTTFWTGFNSTATPNIMVDLDILEIQDSGTGSKVRIVITNDDKSAFDVYSTISGVEN